MRRVPVSLAVVILLLGSVAPVAAVGPTAGVAEASSFDESTSNASSVGSVEEDAAEVPPDPESDRLGWENGYWHNESIDLDQSDGVSDEELTAVVSRTMARVELIRGLEFKNAVPVKILSREEFRKQGANRSVNESFRTFDNAKFEAMFLVGENEDALKVQNANSGSNILGYYSSSRDSIVLIANNKSSPKLDEYTLAHELVHALQDQHFDLSSIQSETRDGSNANGGIVEGDANYVQHLYEKRCTNTKDAWNGTCVQPPASEAGGGGSPANMGVYFLKFQPYSDGPNFVASIRQQGGWDAVNAVYDNPPASAEQVIHPQKYGQDQPTDVVLNDTHGDGWDRIRPPNRSDYAEVGQSGVASMFVYPLYHGNDGGRIVEPNEWLNYTGNNQVSSFDPLNYGFGYAEGWDGDRMHFYRNDDGEGAYVWRIVWDTPEDAMEFREGYVQMLNYWGAEQLGPNTYRIQDGEFADAFHVVLAGDTVTIINAPTVDQLTEVRTSANVEVTPSDTPTETTETTDPGTTDDETSEGSVTTDQPEPTETTSPGFVVVTAVLALLAAAFVAARR